HQAGSRQDGTAPAASELHAAQNHPADGSLARHRQFRRQRYRRRQWHLRYRWPQNEQRLTDTCEHHAAPICPLKTLQHERMIAMRPTIGAIFLLALVSTLPVQAASSLTARASGVLAVHTGPHEWMPVIDKLASNERVRLDFCTRQSRWCHVI